ncbi:ABC transporter substrate-binding protein [Caballeronia sp. LZ034LL]|uniref:ABC transporter substrate-binding protein n=1 Tax=Caballeronia sp. LZ034LL TaxID=3038567 RepID=UPI0028588059|nr:ABC transporter substrate-binding protein [Caballeronia sp. LZ034LL]MDR5835678.1 ABC transporter substrate-binding protein [Caballeronia sp. LZ034LL]
MKSHAIFTRFIRHAAFAFVAAAAGLASVQAAEPLTTVRFALDWTPNTDHTGLFVAIDKGYFKDAGIDVKVLPYNQTSPDALVSAGVADFGTTFQDAITFSIAAGAKVKSVFAIDQHWASSIGVLASRDDLKSPKDLDGKKFGGVGTPGERAIVSQVIKNAGGKGDFKLITLRSSYIEALKQGTVDFALPYMAWEGLEAKRAGKPVKYFKYTDYGFPDAYAVIVVSNPAWLKTHDALAHKFVGALQKGYEFAAAHPEEAAQSLIKLNPSAFQDKDFVVESQKMLSPDYRDAQGKVGPQTVAQWSGLSGFLFRKGLLSGPDGKPLTTEPNWANYFTNDYLTKN